jgi:hypothetical protein
MPTNDEDFKATIAYHNSNDRMWGTFCIIVGALGVIACIREILYAIFWDINAAPAAAVCCVFLILSGALLVGGIMMLTGRKKPPPPE